MLIPFHTIVEKYGKPNGILHCGASSGQEAKDYSAHVDNVVWIEALPHVYNSLVNNVAQYKHKCILACVSDQDGIEVNFHEANNEGQSSSMLAFGTHAQVHPTVKYIADHKMVTTTIETIYKNHNLSGLDFLNFDVQCAELQVLKGMGDILNDFKWAYLEVNQKPLYKGCALIGEVDRYMGKFNFKRVETRWAGRTFWGDALYVKK